MLKYGNTIRSTVATRNEAVNVAESGDNMAMLSIGKSQIS